jgi:hypothetical protein
MINPINHWTWLNFQSLLPFQTSWRISRIQPWDMRLTCQPHLTTNGYDLL